MSNIDVFNIITGTSSVISLLMAIWATLTARKANEGVKRILMTSNNSISQQIIGGVSHKQAGYNLYDNK